MDSCELLYRHAHQLKDGRVINHECGGYWVPCIGEAFKGRSEGTIYPIEVFDE